MDCPTKGLEFSEEDTNTCACVLCICVHSTWLKPTDVFTSPLLYLSYCLRKIATLFLLYGFIQHRMDPLDSIITMDRNPDTPERTRLAPKYTSAEGILESRLFHPILIDGGQRGQSSLKTTGPSSLGCLPDYLVLL
ncbi:hypothetical protein YC2023_035568 [Brassica napus]